MAQRRCPRPGSHFVQGSFAGAGVTAGQRCPVQERYILACREWRQFKPVASCVPVPVVRRAAVWTVWCTAQVSVYDTASGAGPAAGIPLVGRNDLSVVPAGLVPYLVQQAGHVGVGQRLGWLFWVTTGAHSAATTSQGGARPETWLRRCAGLCAAGDGVQDLGVMPGQCGAWLRRSALH